MAVTAHMLVAMEALIYKEAKDYGKTKEQARKLGNSKLSFQKLNFTSITLI